MVREIKSVKFMALPIRVPLTGPNKKNQIFTKKSYLLSHMWGKTYFIVIMPLKALTKIVKHIAHGPGGSGPRLG